MRTAIGIIALIFCASTHAQLSPANADVPTISSMLETRDGGKIHVRFKAQYWGDAGANGAVRYATDMNRFLSPRMATLQTNVQLKLGTYFIDPGAYILGFEAQENGEWHFIVGDAAGEYLRMPIPVQNQPNYMPYLSFVLTPGVTARDFVLNGLYGKAATSMRWVISGVPSEVESVPPTDSPSQFDRLGLESLHSGNNSVLNATSAQIQSATPPIRRGPPTPKPRAGSGAFRRYIEELQGGKTP
ncbi:MAG: hypothetical protein P9L94_14255 [Candidatus Hinthialibacter antarcticus]|nr:hypothetical protein [Candidatus Hinthialibacter antarcticus]